MWDGRVGQGWLLGCIIGALLSIGCGSADSGSRNAGAGTNSGGPSAGGELAGGNANGGRGGLAGAAAAIGGTSGGGNAGTSGGSNAPTTKYQACVAYMNAQCNKRYRECSGYEPVADPCPEFLRWCPDFLFSEDSQLDIAGALACAETWRSYSCDLLNQEISPKCGLPAGKRALGEPCKYRNQCQSYECAAKRGPGGTRLECGQCIPEGKAGDPCDDGSFACPDGYECTGSGCQLSVRFNLPDGELCERYGQCYGDSLCFPTSDGSMRCQPLRKAGESCSNGAYCDSNTTCANDEICRPRVPAGIGGVCSGDGCIAEAHCEAGPSDPSQLVCVADVELGQPCKVKQDTDLRGNCSRGLSCFCQGTSCTRTCLLERREGEPCGDASSFCIPGTQCEAGKCVGVELQGIAEAACSP